MVESDAPSSYEELFTEYFDYVRGLVRSLGIRENDDVASEIMVRFYARGFLEKYDPTITVTRGGVEKQTSFRAFLRAFVERYSRHYRERQGVRDHREPLKCDQERSPGRLWVEIHADPYVANFDETLAEEELVVLIRNHLAKLPRRGDRDLVRLFDLMVPQARTAGRIDRVKLAKEYGVSESVVGSMIRELRMVLSESTLPTPA